MFARSSSRASLHGHAKEVNGGALGVNRDAWTDERVLRSIGTRLSHIARSHHTVSRLQHAVRVGNAPRVAFLCKFATPMLATQSLKYAVAQCKRDEILCALVACGADINEAMPEGVVPKHWGWQPHSSMTDPQRVATTLTHHANSVTALTALRAGISVRLPGLVSANVEAGVRQWKAKDPGGFLAALSADLRMNRSLLDPSMCDDAKAIVRIVYSHATLPLEYALCAAGLLDDAAWFHRMATPTAVAALIANPTRSGSNWGANVDAAFWAACAVGSTGVAKTLLAAGADSHAGCVDRWASELAIVVATQRGHGDIVRCFAEFEPYGGDVLLAACTLGLYDVAQFSVGKRAAAHPSFKSGANAFRSSHYPDSLSTPLAAACHAGHAHIVELLCSHGVDLSDPECAADSAAAVLRSSLASPVKLAVLATLIRLGLDVNAEFCSQDSALFTVIEQASLAEGDAPLLSALLDAGASVTDASVHGYTALHAACLRLEAVHLVGLLLQHPECDAEAEVGPEGGFITDPTASQLLGASPLIVACMNGNTPTVRLLLAHGVDVNRA